MASPWLHTALLVPLSALAGAAILCHRTPDLSEIKTSLEGKRPPIHDLAAQLELTVLKQEGALEISESELNDFLSRRLVSSQVGFSASMARLDRVLVDLEESRARVNLCWSVAGHLTVTSVDLAIRRTPTDFTLEVLGGAYGRLEVKRGLLLPITPALEKLAQACKPEIDALFKLPHIRFAKDKLVVDPVFPRTKPPGASS